jgi:hypothetical protein
MLMFSHLPLFYNKKKQVAKVSPTFLNDNVQTHHLCLAKIELLAPS